MSIRHRTTAVVGALVAAGAIAACSSIFGPPLTSPNSTPTATVEPSPSSDPSAAPEPSPTPTVDPAQALQDQNTADAIAAFEAHIAAADRVGQAGMVGWETEVLSTIGSGELREETVSLYTQLIEQGVRQTGDTEISSIVVTDYVADPTGAGHEQVRLDACLDISKAEMVNSGGESVLLEGFPTRLITTVLMQHQGPGGYWTVNESVTDQERPC